MPGKIEKAMVLAAGYGTRLKPLTDRLPKPLVPVAGKPMINYALDRLRAYGIRDIVVNASHHKDHLIAWLSGIQDLNIQVSEEAEPLETGGGLKHALPLLGHKPFFVINSDIIWVDEPGPAAGSSPAGADPGFGRAELPLGLDAQQRVPTQPQESALDRLNRHWDGDKMDILLLAQSRARAVGYDRGEDHLFIKPANTIGWNDADAPYIMAGIGIVHPRIFSDSPDGKFSVKILWHQALSRDRLFCLPHRGQWFQAGRIEDIQKAESLLKHCLS
jgi:N-acetyl-alpha-D-muramate 1-phosphate uridylyltransferase